MRHNISSFLRTVIAVTCGWVTGRMMELFLPLESLITITAVTIPLIILLAFAEICRAIRMHRLITNTNKIISAIKKQAEAGNTGKDDGS